MKPKSFSLKILLLLIVCFLLTLLSNKVYSQSKIDCSKATTQAEINECAHRQYVTADKELNEIYKKVSAKLDAQQKMTLLQSQRKWVSFRDEYCKIYGLIYNGGSMAASAILKCKTETTRARIVELQTLFEQVNL